MTESREHAVVGHHDLLHAARSLYLVAGLGEADALAEANAEFLLMLEAHLRDEAMCFMKLDPGEARLLEHGQHRLVSLARALGARAVAGCSEPGRRCRELAEELLAHCFLQARDENSALQSSLPIEPDRRAR